MSHPKRQLIFPGLDEEDNQRTAGRLDERETIALGDRTAASGDQAIYVMDVHNLMYQVFHALPDIRSPRGQPVGAVHGFIQDVARLVEKNNADYVFCAFDSPLEETFRKRRYPAYKANRKAMPEDLRVQIPLVRRMLEAMGVPTLECTGYEADDVLATVARKAERRKMLCFLVTGDKDCRQLISERVKIFNIRKNEYFDAESLAKAWGIRADQAVDFQTLVGDSVDNVPGIPLIGPKTAQQLLAQYETLDNLLAHAEEVPGAKRRANLTQARESAKFTRELVRLIDSVPLEIDWEASRLGGMDQQQIQPLCRELGLHRLAKRLAGLSG
jgi:DNA polymerase-1